MSKVNENTMREQYDGQYKTFCKKNSDYGNSFEESLDKHGIVASIVRMGDKMNRLESLTDDSRTQQVGSESLLDTLEDLSNYAAMTACWLKGVRAEDGEEEVGSVYVFGQDEPYLTFKKPKDHPHNDDTQIDAFKYALRMGEDRTKEEIIGHELRNIIPYVVEGIKQQRDPKMSLEERTRIVEARRIYYKHIARIILDTEGIHFDDFLRYMSNTCTLMSNEKQMIYEGVLEEIYLQTDKNPGGEEESEFRTKKFHIPKEEEEGLNEKVLKSLLWFLPLNQNYRGDE